MTTSSDPGSTHGPDDPHDTGTTGSGTTGSGTTGSGTTGSGTTGAAATDPDLRAAEQQDTDSDPATMNPRSGAAARDESSEQYEDTDADPNNLNPRDLRPGADNDG